MVGLTGIMMWLVLLSDVIIVLYALESFALITGVRTRRVKAWNWLGKHALWCAFLISLAATLGSLYFSEILKYTPCVLCWYQRIFIYPQVFLFGVALWKKEKTRIWAYSGVLSVVGAIIAVFQYYIQVVPKPLVTIPCSLAGSASCTETFVTYFGYITIPIMALTAFLSLLILSRLAKRSL